MRRGTEGFSVLEVLVCVLLSALLAQSAWSALRHQAKAVRNAAEASERLEEARIVRHVLGGEIRDGVAGRDWSVPAGDSVGLRAFRGVAVPCGPREADGAIPVRAAGIRKPDPAKDSLLLLLADGSWRVVALDGRSRSPRRICLPDGPGWEADEWRVEGFTDDFVLARYFERGSYHLSGGTLRYRRGRGGRQPLGPDLLDDRSSVLSSAAGGRALGIRLFFRGCGATGCGGPWDAVLRVPGS